MAKEDKIIRFPRPMGTTAMALEYQKTRRRGIIGQGTELSY